MVVTLVEHDRRLVGPRRGRQFPGPGDEHEAGHGRAPAAARVGDADGDLYAGRGLRGQGRRHGGELGQRQGPGLGPGGGDLLQLYYKNSPGSGNGTFVSSVIVQATVGEVTTVLQD